MKWMQVNLVRSSLLATVIFLVFGCGAPTESTESLVSSSSDESEAEAITIERTSRFGGILLDMPQDLMIAHPELNANRSAFFGDLHVHTDYSFDASAFGTVATPNDAYRYAQGEVIEHATGYLMKLDVPLDFYAVTDHAMFLGTVKAAMDPSTEFSKLPHAQGLHNLNREGNRNIDSLVVRGRAFKNFLPDTLFGVAEGKIDEASVNEIVRDAWADIIKSAESNYKPGKFTTFVAYEYTSSTTDSGNLHRNVIFRNADKLPAVPFSRFHSQNPEGLWRWMDNLRANGIESLAIPHNSNGSNGQMFKMVDWAGNPLDDDYGERRIRNEPLIELTQIKGTSETHPLLSDTDEWANFEIMPYRIGTSLPSAISGSYAREALLNGLLLSDQNIANPYQFGFIGSSDTHTGASPLVEETYFGKVGVLDSQPELRGSVPVSPETADLIIRAGRLKITEIDGQPYATGSYETFGASGLTGVWAETNTRDSIYQAFRRKETFATSGPRMKVRLFAGYGLQESMLSSSAGITQAYQLGVSMGSELLPNGNLAPTLLAWAMRDPLSAPLQRLQIIKGWVEEGEPREKVYDVACSDGLKVDAATHRCPDNGATVDLTNCSTSASVGAAELRASWTDPEFDASEQSFYYVRALENPTCRWSTWDAVRAGVPPRSDLNATLQERVWSSSIWFKKSSEDK